MSERRYSDDEVRRIIALAAEAEVAATADAERPWTLRDIEQIGSEAGLTRPAVAAAALALEHAAEAPEPARYFGLPVAVARAVPLARALSDEDWARLVVRLRETFAAEGRTRERDGRREWRVGNLRVTHEPAGPAGALLQMRTRKGNGPALLQVGMVLVLVAIVALLRPLLTGEGPDARHLGGLWAAGTAGVALLVAGLVQLPVWARARTRQFEALATYARRIAATPS